MGYHAKDKVICHDTMLSKPGPIIYSQLEKRERARVKERFVWRIRSKGKGKGKDESDTQGTVANVNGIEYDIVDATANDGFDAWYDEEIGRVTAIVEDGEPFSNPTSSLDGEQAEALEAEFYGITYVISQTLRKR